MLQPGDLPPVIRLPGLPGGVIHTAPTPRICSTSGEGFGEENRKWPRNSSYLTFEDALCTSIAHLSVSRYHVCNV